MNGLGGLTSGDVLLRDVRRPGWWLVERSDDGLDRVVAGPFTDRTEAAWAAAVQGPPGAVDAEYGVRTADGSLSRRPSPEERAWFRELGDQLDRLPHDWDDLLSDTDPLTTLVVEIVAALVEAGLPLHDGAQDQPAGGVCLMPELASGGVVVSWRAHDRMSLHHVRGTAADTTVQQSMNAVVADVLGNLGFVVETVGGTGSCLVTALR